MRDRAGGGVSVPLRFIRCVSFVASRSLRRISDRVASSIKPSKAACPRRSTSHGMTFNTTWGLGHGACLWARNRPPISFCSSRCAASLIGNIIIPFKSMHFNRQKNVSVLLAIAAPFFGVAWAADLDRNSIAARPAETHGPLSAQEPSVFSPKPYAADPDWGIMVFGGVSAGRTRLVELIPMPWSGNYGDNYFVGGALSRRLIQFDKHWKIEGEVGAGYRFKQVNAPEGWAAVFLRFDGFPWNHWVYTTVAVSTGLSYVERVSDVEKDAGSGRGHPDGSKLLHYFAPEITFAHPDRRDWEMLIRYHHRSGVAGAFNGVWGGSNVITGGIRHRF